MINIRKIYAEINDELREIQLYVHGEVGYITLECMSKEDYEALEEIEFRGGIDNILKKNLKKLGVPIE